MTLRRDAARNRDKLIEAARTAFAEQGLDVPLDVVADRACVGIATLYRRLPTRDALIAAAFEDRMAEYVRAAEEALQDPDPWTGFTRFVEHICEMQAADRGVGDVFTRTLPATPVLDEATGESAPAASRRFVGLMLEAVRAVGAGVIAPPLDPRDMYRALRRAWRPRRATPSA